MEPDPIKSISFWAGAALGLCTAMIIFAFLSTVVRSGQITYGLLFTSIAMIASLVRVFFLAPRVEITAKKPQEKRKFRIRLAPREQIKNDDSERSCLHGKKKSSKKKQNGPRRRPR